MRFVKFIVALLVMLAMASGGAAASGPQLKSEGVGASGALGPSLLTSGDYLFYQPGDSTGVAGSSEIITAFAMESEIANDFILPGTGSQTIGRVRWWGKYFDYSAGNPHVTSFIIRFYADSAGSPGTMISQFTVPNNANETYVGGTADVPIYGYYTDLSISLSADTPYWLAIQAGDHPYPPQWGRLAAVSTVGAESRFRSAFFEYPSWTAASVVFGQAYDASFALERDFIPGPLSCDCCNNYPTVQQSVFGFLDGEMAVATGYSATGADAVLQIIDVSDRSSQPFLRPTSTTWANWFAPRYGGPTATPWSRDNLGCIFGLALDKRGDIYTTATSCYPDLAGIGDFPPGGPGQPGTIWKIDGTTGAISAWLIITGQAVDPGVGAIHGTSNAYPALGNIAYDCEHDQFFVTNLEDGKIYRIPASGVGMTTYDPFGADPGTPGFALLGERLWGIGVYDNRVYFSRWRENGSDWGGWSGSVSAANSNEIWSISLNATGAFTGSPILEITMPVYASSPTSPSVAYSNPVADIEFSPDGRMLLAERSMKDATTAGSHDSRLLEFENSTSPPTPGVPNWQQTAPAWSPGKYSVDRGTSPTNPSSAGGCDYANCEDVWAMMDAIHYEPSDPLGTDRTIYGLLNIPASGGGGPAFEHCHAIDLDGETETHDKRELGDVDVPCMVALCGTKWLDADGNGVRNFREPGLSNWDIYDVGMVATNTLTDSLGRYSFMPVTGGRMHTLGENLRSGWSQTYPSFPATHLVDLDSCHTVTDLDFGNIVSDSLAGWICVEKYSDNNCNGIRDEGEVRLAGWQVTLTGPYSTSLTTSSTEACTRVPVGTYQVCEINQPGWIPKSPPGGCTTVTVTMGSRDTVRFANCPTVEGSCVEPPECLVAWWPFDEGTGGAGTVVHDVAGCAHGTLVGPAGWTSGQYVNNSLNFFTPGSYVEVPSTAQHNFGVGSFSIDAWVFRECGDTSSTRTIVDKRVTDPGFGMTWGYHFFIQNGHLGVTLQQGFPLVPPPLTTFLAPTQLPAGWNFVAVTVCRDPANPAANQLRLWVNDTLVGFWDGAAVMYGSVNTPIGTPLRIGQQCPGLDTTMPFCGFIDEVEIFNCCLDSLEVLAIARAGTAGKCMEECYVESISPICEPTGSLNLTVFSAAPTAQNYVWSIAPLTGPGCTPPGLTTFSPMTGTLNVGAATCGPVSSTIPITIHLPPTMPWMSTFCYQVTVRNTVTGNVFTCTGKALFDPGLCAWRWPDALQRLGPGATGAALFGIQNPGASQAITVNYRLVPQAGHGETGNLAMRLNGNPAGTPVTGSITIPEGQVGTIPFSVQIDAFQPFRVYEVVLECDTGDGIFLPRVVLPVVTATPGIVSEIEGAPAEPRAARTHLDIDPNPFAGATTVRLALAQAGFVTVRIHDVTGRLVKTLRHGRMEAGAYEVAWDGRDDHGERAGSGMYFVHVQTSAETLTAKLIRLR